MISFERCINLKGKQAFTEGSLAAFWRSYFCCLHLFIASLPFKILAGLREMDAAQPDNRGIILHCMVTNLARHVASRMQSCNVGCLLCSTTMD